MIDSSFLRHAADPFIHVGNVVTRISTIKHVDISEIENHVIYVCIEGRLTTEKVSGFDALELIWMLKPGSLEGKRIKYYKYMWAIHNLFAHPIMQLLAFCGLYKAAMWIHDKTVPKPKKLK